MTERLQKIIASSGVTSRRKAEDMILAGRVTCNGHVCLLGESADPDIDIILLDGKPLPSGDGYTYILLNKPRGYVTTLSDEKGRRTVMDLISDCATRVYPVGRLDMDSEGLLILTNDGDLANRMMHPRHQIDKTYQVYVTNYSEQGLEKLGQSVVLDGYRIAKPSVRVISEDEQGNARLEIIIHEGRNRQVRKMCALAGMDVIRLIRVAEGPLILGDLPLGKWRKLTEAEVTCLKDHC